MLLATINSIDVHTSLWGYYSRFQGGLISLITYVIILILTATHIAHNPRSKQILITTIIITALIVSIYGILQHFGIDAKIWKQDVKSRVFSTLGQPNWLAAYLSAVVPLTWIYTTSKSTYKTWFLITSNIIIYLALLYTKSRSGFLAYIAAFTIYWSLKTFADRQWKTPLFLITPLLIISIIIGTPFTSTLQALKTSETPITSDISSNPQEGGTESGIIRQIVWQGAIKLGNQYPYFGTGPETFAYSYYWTRPQIHNLISEWDFLYNKAHNEFLNYLANTGYIGLGSYIFLIISGIWFFYKSSLNSENKLLSYAAISIWISISITNFFGFSVVIINLLFFILPAFFVSINQTKPRNNNLIYKTIFFVVLISASYFLITIFKFFLADTNFALARKLYSQSDYSNSYQLISKSIRYNPQESIYYDLGSKIAADIAVGLAQNQHIDEANQFRDSAISLSQYAIYLNPVHTTIWRTRAGVFMNLAVINPQDYQIANNALLQNAILAPTDAKVPYNQAILQARLKNYDQSITYLNQALNLKPNYYEALYARAIYQYMFSVDQTTQQVKDFTILNSAITDLTQYIDITNSHNLDSELNSWSQLLKP